MLAMWKTSISKKYVKDYKILEPIATSRHIRVMCLKIQYLVAISALLDQCTVATSGHFWAPVVLMNTYRDLQKRIATQNLPVNYHL